MNYYGRSPPHRTAHSDSASMLSPLTICNRFQNAVPSGTVASRVHHLQSLENSASTRPSATPTNRRRENSRPDSGRRVSNKFARAASRNTKPDEQPQVEPSHSLLGLNAPRTNREEERAVADERVRYCRTAGLHGQIKPQGMTRRVQYDAVAPWFIIPKGRSYRSKRSECSKQETDVLGDFESARNNCQLMAQASVLSDHNKTEIKSRQEDTMDSISSAQTTSTIRRQSVRDLFDHYCIKRPAGLVSSEGMSTGIENSCLPAGYTSQCYICSTVNSSFERRCWRCGHGACTGYGLSVPNVFDERGPQIIDRLAIKENKFVKPAPLAREYKAAEKKPVKAEPLSAAPLSQHEVEEGASMRRRSSSTSQFPPFQVVQHPIKTQNSRLTSAGDSTRSEQGSISPVISRSRTTTRVKDSPFLIADLLSAGKPICWNPSLRKHILIQDGPSQHEHKAGSQSVSSSSDSRNCDSPTCRATHYGHAPYRHSITCTRKNRRPYETDNGYVADASVFDDTAQTNSKFHLLRAASRLSRLDSYPSPILQPGPSPKYQPLEYVECHGYPRTGHTRHRHGTPISSGDVGQCQHCLDDCQCTACQSTHHSVRCCVHKCHKAILHKHQTFKKEPFTPNSIEPGPSPPRSPKISQTLRTRSPSFTVSKVIAPTLTPKREIRAQPSRPDAPESRSKRQTHSKTLSLLKAKQSSFVTEKNKSPTPPPWISTSKGKPISSDAMTSEWKPKPHSMGTAFGADAYSDPIPKFTEKLKPRPPFPRNGSNAVIPHLSNEEQLILMVPEDCHQHRYDRLDNGIFSSLELSGLTQRRPSTRGSPTRVGRGSPLVSRTASRRLSAFLQLADTKTVPLLTQKLKEHKDEWGRIERYCDERIEVVSRGRARSDLVGDEEGGKAGFAENLPGDPCASERGERGKTEELKPVDDKASFTCGLDEVNFVVPRSNRDDVIHDGPIWGEIVSTKGIATNPSEDEHECIWTNKILADRVALATDRENASARGRSAMDEKMEKNDSGILDVTIIFHMEGKDDVVLKAAVPNCGMFHVHNYGCGRKTPT